MARDEQASTSTQPSFFRKWLNLQMEDLSKLHQSLNLNQNDPNINEFLDQIIDKNIKHFDDYIEERSRLCQVHVTEFFAPSWCSTLENSLLWIGGCRPSIFIRLIYALCGSQFETHLIEFLQTGDKQVLDLGLSLSQINKVNMLQRKSIREEEKLTSRLTSLEEEIVDKPLYMLAKMASEVCELDSETNKALDDHDKSMASLLEEADKLRINILKEVIDILTPLQAVEFLATSKKLHLCVHEWGQKRDQMHSLIL